jgi:tight adherence protein C
MILLTTISTFLAVLAVVGLVSYAFQPRGGSLTGRLGNLWHAREKPDEPSGASKHQQRVERMLAGFAKVLPASEKLQARSGRLLTRAGIHSPSAVIVLRGAKVLLVVIFLAAVLLSGLYKLNSLFVIGAAILVGFLAPDFWLTRRIKKRQKKIVRGLADTLDLLVVSVESGMGLDRALFRVAQELLIVHRELSEELHLVNLEMRLGKSRAEALRDLAVRTGVEDIRLLVAVLIQTDRLGTDLAQALRVQSESLRTAQRQRAEELAVKATVKMVPALVFFIFPALFVVLLGPAVIGIIREFGMSFAH